MLVICKFSKKITLIEEKNTFIAKEWACVFFTKLDFIDWGLSKELITDRDPKFPSSF